MSMTLSKLYGKISIANLYVSSRSPQQHMEYLVPGLCIQINQTVPAKALDMNTGWNPDELFCMTPNSISS